MWPPCLRGISPIKTRMECDKEVHFPLRSTPTETRNCGETVLKSEVVHLLTESMRCRVAVLCRTRDDSTLYYPLTFHMSVLCTKNYKHLAMLTPRSYQNILVYAGPLITQTSSVLQPVQRGNLEEARDNAENKLRMLDNFFSHKKPIRFETITLLKTT